jgi:hypothetical protein
MAKRDSYSMARVDVIQPIQDRPEDKLVRIRMEEYIDGLLPEPDPTRGRSVSEIARDNSWADEEEPELPAPPRPDWA